MNNKFRKIVKQYSEKYKVSKEEAVMNVSIIIEQGKLHELLHLLNN